MPGTAPGSDYAAFAGNPYNVVAPSLEYASNPDAVTSKTYHGITLSVGGKVLGRVQSWNTTGAYTREGNHVYELNNQTWGLPVDYVPSRATGFNIAATVAELWGSEIEVQLGMKSSGDQIWNLIHQTRSFTADEFWFRGVDLYRIWRYRGCWLTDRNETDYRADGDARVIANFNFNYVSRQLVAGGAAQARGALL
jgi:hypothetical protein